MVVTPAQLDRIRQSAENAATQQTPAAKTNVVHEEQFRQAMDTPAAPNQPNQSQPNVSVSNVNAVEPTSQTTSQPIKPPNLGDRILANMQRASKPPQVNMGEVSSRSAMEAQYKLTAFNIDSQLESKAVGSAAKSVQSLIKMQ